MAEPDIHRQALARIEQILHSQRDDPRLAIGQITDLILQYRTGHLVNFLLRACGQVVQSGPFAGMKYLNVSACGPLLPKLLGCYEAELHGVLARIARTNYGTVVNIGCGEGYYAVGLARLLPAARVYAFDSNPAAASLCRQLAALNRAADRVVVAGRCGISHLEELARGHALVVCDCEGAEVDLLDPRRVPGLATCDILVEMHGEGHPGAAQILPGRFRETHDVSIIPHCGRDWTAFPALRQWKQLDQLLSVWEGRAGPTPWAFMVAR